MGWTRTKADTAGRVVEAASFSGADLPAPWGSNASTTGAVTTQYDADCTTVTDQAGNARKPCKDALGRLASVVENPTGPSRRTRPRP